MIPSQSPRIIIPSEKIKEAYEHVQSPSVFIMFDKQFQARWCYSGNNLRSIYLEDPSHWISGPLELPITADLDKKLTDMMDNY